ncbi:CPBP family intramembrane glutamic endopeptidase [Ottowia testudinis]|uniref:CPBP family intramembrane metalloprotease n=1 Tax=Ottowia testudinis TaxID=2816950 RepID=A0A975CF40_9BURK|nr:type II CAAX endopeptidase family protein [Ottowia testudinis]QTD44616.1 CPBP family intramembrane metalloprotease [Ottowia testudinis]
MYNFNNWPIWYVLVAYIVAMASSSSPGLIPPHWGSQVMLTAQLVSFFGLSLLAVLVLNAWRKQRTLGSDFGFQPGRLGRTLAVAAVFFALHYVMVWAAERYVPAIGRFGKNPLEGVDMGSSPARQMLMIVNFTILAPLGEEVLYRGLMFASAASGLARWSWLRSKISGKGVCALALMLSSALFSEIHSGESTPHEVLALYFLNGALFAGAYWVSGSLWAPVLVHSMNNAVVVGGALPQSAVPILQPDVLRVLCVFAPLICVAVLYLLWRILPHDK